MKEHLVLSEAVSRATQPASRRAVPCTSVNSRDLSRQARRLQEHPEPPVGVASLLPRGGPPISRTPIPRWILHGQVIAQPTCRREWPTVSCGSPSRSRTQHRGGGAGEGTHVLAAQLVRPPASRRRPRRGPRCPEHVPCDGSPRGGSLSAVRSGCRAGCRGPRALPSWGPRGCGAGASRLPSGSSSLPRLCQKPTSCTWGASGERSGSWLAPRQHLLPPAPPERSPGPIKELNSRRESRLHTLVRGAQ